jgi:hypothetical protein
VNGWPSAISLSRFSTENADAAVSGILKRVAVAAFGWMSAQEKQMEREADELSPEPVEYTAAVRRWRLLNCSDPLTIASLPIIARAEAAP